MLKIVAEARIRVTVEVTTGVGVRFSTRAMKMLE
jgi:hypothetical protein